MLPAQVSYWTLVENERHNKVNEELGFKNFEETKRHNLATENVSLGTLKEASRHNAATEMNANLSLIEASRHNKESEAIGKLQANAAMIQAGAASMNAQTNRMGIPISMAEAFNHAKQAAATQKQAQVAEERLAIEQQEADTHWYSALTNSLLKGKELGISQQNADTNAFNAETNRQNAETNAKNATTQRFRAIMDGFDSVTNNSREGIKTTFDVLTPFISFD